MNHSIHPGEEGSARIDAKYRRHRSEWIYPLFIGTVGTVFLWLSFPPTPIVFNDDFGYLRSIAETIQHGRPWTDDWLEPWAASLSVLSASIFKVTGSFRMATYGLQAACAGVMIIFGIALFRARKMSWLAAVAWTAVFLSFPTILWKLSEFGAVPLYLACLLAGMWFAERRMWVPFALCWFVAVTSRQSALLWLILPATMLLETTPAGWRNAGRTLAKIAAIALPGGLVYYLVQREMNRTNAQMVMMPSLLGNFNGYVFLQHFGIALAVFLASAGVGNFVLRVTGLDPVRLWNRRNIFVGIASIFAIAALWVLDVRTYIQFEHVFLNGHKGGLYLTGVAILGVAGWCSGKPSVRFAYLASALAAAALMGLRPAVWDYYLADVAIFGLFSVTPTTEVFQPKDWSGPLRALGYAAAAILLWSQSSFALETKRSLDWNFAVVSLYERAFRTGQLEPIDLSAAPFGYKGWHLYPYFVANDGASGAYIAEFQKYIRTDASRLQAEWWEEPPPSIRNGKLSENERLLASGIFRVQWRQRLRFSLIKRSVSETPALKMNPGRYTFESFPLNDEEWRRRLAGNQR